MLELRPREPVGLADDFGALVAWYIKALGFAAVSIIDEAYRYATLETAGGVRLGIADARQTEVHAGDRARNTVVLQFEVDDVAAFFERVASQGGLVTFGPAQDAEAEFWFGGIADLEGNRCWAVDANCP